LTTETTDAHEHEPGARGLRLVPALLMMTVVSGLIDAISYLGLGHVFTANMTGNVVVLGFAAAGTPGFSTPLCAVSLGSFLLGAMAGGRTERLFDGRSRRTWTRVTFAVEAALVGAASAVAFTAPDSIGRVYALVVLTAFAMGLRNATVRKLGVRDLTTTTVLTTTLTGLASDSRAGGGSGSRSPRRAASAVSLLAGAAFGGWLMIHQGLPVALLAAALTTGVLAVTVSERE
jgi:uncharacterized membrane protein YoaK (UPF0700 family)